MNLKGKMMLLMKCNRFGKALLVTVACLICSVVATSKASALQWEFSGTSYSTANSFMNGACTGS